MILHLAVLAQSATTTATTVAGHAKSSGSILDPIAKPIAGLLAAIYSVVPNYGVAILVLSVVWMVIISPLTLKSTRSMLAMQKLQPQLKKLQEQHKNDRQAFAQAQMDLFREHQVSPFGSCLPMLLPLPIFFALFRVIDGLSHTSNGQPAPKYLSHSTRMYSDIVAAHGHLVAFGMDLSKNAFSPHSGVLAALPFWILLLVMAGTSYFQSAQMMSRNPAATQNNPQMRMMKYLPLIFVIFCARFPAGVVLYYAMSNLCRIVQQDFMYRFDPKVKTLVAQEVIEVEELTHDIDEREKRGPGYTPPRGAKPADTPAPQSGRSRFRDLLSAATEQQKRQQEAKAAGSAGKQAAKGPAQPANSNGAPSSTPKPAPPKPAPPKAGPAKSAPPKAAGTTPPNANGNGTRNRPNTGSRTNRKRRGR